MRKVARKSSVYFGDETHMELSEILAASHSATTQSGALRGIIHQYVKLLRLQATAEKAGGYLVLSVQGSDGPPPLQLDLRL